MTDLGIAVNSVETGSRGAVRMFLRNKAAVFGLVIFLSLIHI